MQFQYPICTLFSWFLVKVSYLCMDDFLPLRMICLYWWAFPFHNFLVSSCDLFSFAKRSSFSICCKADMVLNSLSFCLYVRLLFSHQIWTRAFLSRVFLVISFSLLLLYIYLATPFLPTNIADSLMGNLLYVTSCFSFVGFNIFSVFHFCLFE